MGSTIAELVGDGDKSTAEISLEKEVELNASPFEAELIKRGYKLTGSYYTKTNSPYAFRASTKDEDKAKVIFGYKLVGSVDFEKLDNVVKQEIRSKEYRRRSMQPVHEGLNYSVGFSIKYRKVEEVFKQAKELSDTILGIIVSHCNQQPANIKYIDANTAYSMQMKYQQNRPKK